MDTLTKAERSRVMGLVKSKNTKPERIVRRIVRSLGLRHRSHDRRLPGKPDLVFPETRRVIFVHGCFWHKHKGCAGNRVPKSRVAFWKNKLNSNRSRDRLNLRELKKLKWRAHVIWECETGNPSALKRRLARIRLSGT
ncbi:MAG: DNA mismatch endonuclease Vsr [Elusimicrobia bacterium]|nr:DNA mismatch endonuclease Vsr [Elusimicrobiota bacterium]